MKKKWLGLLLVFCLILQVQTVLAVTGARVRMMYAADGRELYVAEDEVEAYKEVGWFTAPPVWMYAADGRQMLVSGDEIEAYKKVGWYAQPPVLMYAGDGRTLYVSGDEVETYMGVGWYLEPMCTVYAPYDAQLVIPVRELQAYINVGWFSTYDEALYNEVVPVIQKSLREKDYEAAIDECNYALYCFEDYNVFYDDIWNTRYAIMDDWRAKVKQPVIVDYSYTSVQNGTTCANIAFRNISRKTVAAIELEFGCYDVFGDPVNYLGTNVIKANVKDAYLYTLDVKSYYWKLYGRSDTEYIRNIKIKRVAFTDGTVWG